MYLVFDIGGTFIKYAKMTADGEIIEKDKTPTPAWPEKSVDDMLECLVNVYRKYSENETVEGIAISLPGMVDVENGIVYDGGAIKYMDKVKLGKLLSERCDGVKVSLENDGKCAALAEVWKGNAKDAKNACVFVFGTGIGGGVIIDRKVHRGNRLLAGEISYLIENMTMDQLDDIAPIDTMSVDEVYEKLSFLWSGNSATNAIVYKMAKKKGLDMKEVSGELIYKWAEEGDEEAQKLLEEEYFSIAKQCCNLYVILDPDVILIGGGISAQPAFIQGIQKYVDKLSVITKIYLGIKIDVCKFRNDSNLIGALFNYMQMYEDA